MRKTLSIVGFFVLIVLVVIICISRGCHKKSTIVPEPIKNESIETANVNPVKIVQTSENVIDKTDGLFLLPEPVSDFSDLVIANNMRNLNLRIWIFVNGTQEFASDVYKSQSNSKPRQILIGSEVKVKAIAENTEGRAIAKGEVTFITEDARILLSVAKLDKDKIVLLPEKK